MIRPGLLAVETGREDHLLDLIRVGHGQIVGRGPPSEQLGGGPVHVLIGGLGGYHRRDQQLEGVRVTQRRADLGIPDRQPVDDPPGEAPFLRAGDRPVRPFLSCRHTGARLERPPADIFLGRTCRPAHLQASSFPQDVRHAVVSTRGPCRGRHKLRHDAPGERRRQGHPPAGRSGAGNSGGRAPGRAGRHRLRGSPRRRAPSCAGRRERNPLPRVLRLRGAGLRKHAVDRRGDRGCEPGSRRGARRTVDPDSGGASRGRAPGLRDRRLRSSCN